MDAEHIHSPSDKEHIYVGGQHSRDEHTYHVHNSGTGETHTIALDHGGQDVYSANEVHKEGKGKISRAAAHHIHKDHAKEMSYAESVDENMLGFSGAQALGKSKDPRHKDAASHIDHHVRQNSEYHKAGDTGVKDRTRHAVAKKLGYNV